MVLKYAGSSRISKTVNRVGIPQKVIEDSIVTPEEDAHWWYHDETGQVLLGNKKARLELYNYLGANRVGDEEDGHRCTIPKTLFSDSDEILFSDQVPREVLFKNGERVHFVYTESQANGKVCTCFVLPRPKLELLLEVGVSWLSAPELSR